MKVVKAKKFHYEAAIPVYDVVNAGTSHNFIIKGNISDVVVHNCNHGKFSRSKKDFYYMPEGDNIVIEAVSDSAQALGKQIWFALMDETNFAKTGVKDINKAKAFMKSLYDTIDARIGGTFRLGGEVYGKLIACSSKNTDSDFLSEHIEKQLNAGNQHLYIVDKPQWEVLPPEMFSDRKFYFTVGDRYKQGFVIPDENADDEHFQEYLNQGYKIVEAPREVRENFISDYNISLRDIAGISVTGAFGFITQDVITPCIAEDRRNPFWTDTIEIGRNNSASVESFFHIEDVPKHLRSRPINIHCDLAEVKDRAGIAGTCQDGTKTILADDGKKVIRPFYRELFAVGIEAPRGDRVSFQKIINFFVWLRANGFNINIISTDQYQSSFFRESLDQQGFKTDKISVDASMDPYIGLRSLFYDQLIESIKCQLQEDELVNLQQINNRIDHKSDGCFTGDTKIRLVDGRTLSILELMSEQDYKTNWVYTFNESTHRIEPKPIKKVFQTKYTSDLVKVTLDNGETVTCTPNHRFMLRDGSYEEIQNLSPSNSLMSFCEDLHSIISIEQIRQPCWVYDLEIKDNHNFSLDCGIIVHNSKDVSDAFCGSVWTHVINQPINVTQTKPAISASRKVNARRAQQRQNNGLTMFGNYTKY